MKKGLKVVTIGGGSSYTPELVEGFIKCYHELPIKEYGWLISKQVKRSSKSLVRWLCVWLKQRALIVKFI